MKENENQSFFDEAAIRLQQAGFQTGEVSKAMLPVMWNGHSLCEVNREGIMYWKGEADSTEIQQTKEAVHGIVGTVSEYMHLMEAAPPLKAEDLDGDYRLLADFNGTVLAGHSTQHGVQFVTWDWSYDHTGVCHGHYYLEDYIAAKQGFAARAHLVDGHRLFPDELLAEVYRSIQETLDSAYPITAERQKCLETVAKQIEYAVADLDGLVERSNQRELEAGLQQGQTM